MTRTDGTVDFIVYQETPRLIKFGDGFSNMIIPTGVMLMGSLEAAQVPYERWLRFAWSLQVWLILFGVCALSVAYLVGYS